MGYAHNILSSIIGQTLEDISKLANKSVFAYYGPIDFSTKPELLAIMDGFAASSKQDDLLVILHTFGGSAEYAEFIVEQIRLRFKGQVSFVIPDMAMSAGTILCMSGDSILMGNASRLGPTDPQVWNGRSWVPALGYLDMVEELVEKAETKPLNSAQVVLLNKVDLGELRFYQEARELSNDLLRNWLSKYKFKDWYTHASSGEQVTVAEKEKRANEIANILSSNKHWHSHSRMISRQQLLNIKLQIDDLDLPVLSELKSKIYQVHDFIMEVLASQNLNYYLTSSQN